MSREELSEAQERQKEAADDELWGESPRTAFSLDNDDVPPLNCKACSVSLHWDERKIVKGEVFCKDGCGGERIWFDRLAARHGYAADVANLSSSSCSFSSGCSFSGCCSFSRSRFSGCRINPLPPEFEPTIGYTVITYKPHRNLIPGSVYCIRCGVATIFVADSCQ